MLGSEQTAKGARYILKVLKTIKNIVVEKYVNLTRQAKGFIMKAKAAAQCLVVGVMFSPMAAFAHNRFVMHTGADDNRNQHEMRVEREKIMTQPTVSVPDPSSLVLLATGVAGIVAARRIGK